MTHLMLGLGNCHSLLHHPFIASTRYVNMLHMVCPDLFAAQVNNNLFVILLECTCHYPLPHSLSPFRLLLRLSPFILLLVSLL